MPDAKTELLARALRMTPADDEVRGCWDFVVRGIELGWLDHEELAELIVYLRDERDWGIEELLFANLFTERGTRLRVSFVSDRSQCAPSLMIACLVALASG